MISEKLIANNFKRALHMLKISRKEYSSLVGKSPLTVSRMAKGESPIPAKAIYTLSRLTGLSIDYFFTH